MILLTSIFALSRWCTNLNAKHSAQLWLFFPFQVSIAVGPALYDAMETLEETRKSPVQHVEEVTTIVKLIQFQITNYGWHRIPARRWKRPFRIFLMHAYKVVNPKSDAFAIGSSFIYFFSAIFCTLQTGRKLATIPSGPGNAGLFFTKHA